MYRKPRPTGEKCRENRTDMTFGKPCRGTDPGRQFQNPTERGGDHVTRLYRVEKQPHGPRQRREKDHVGADAEHTVRRIGHGSRKYTDTRADLRRGCPPENRIFFISRQNKSAEKADKYGGQKRHSEQCRSEELTAKQGNADRTDEKR